MGWTPPKWDPKAELRPQASWDHWRAAMIVIADRVGLPAAGLTPFSSGSDVVFGGEGYVIKLTAPAWEEEIQTEHAVLGYVAGRLPVTTPEPLALGELEGWPYVVMRRVPGTAVAAVWPTLGRAERLRLAAELGALTAALHALPPPAAADRPPGWAGFLQSCEESADSRHRALGTSAAWLARIPELLAAPRPDKPLVLLHTELLGEHVLAQEVGGRWRLSAALDFADGRVGHPDYEIAAPIEFIFRGEAGCLGTYLDALGWSPAERADAGPRLAAWGVLHRFGCLPRALKAAGDPPPGDVAELVARLYDTSL